jgi:hypothetical protein
MCPRFVGKIRHESHGAGIATTGSTRPKAVLEQTGMVARKQTLAACGMLTLTMDDPSLNTGSALHDWTDWSLRRLMAVRHALIWAAIVWAGTFPDLALATEASAVDYQPCCGEMSLSSWASGPDQPLYTALRSTEGWKQLWPEIEPRQPRDMTQIGALPLPKIDFKKYTLIVTATGKQGALISIQSITESSRAVRVSVVKKKLGTNCVVISATSYPIVVALIPRTQKKVRFEISEKVDDCAPR